MVYVPQEIMDYTIDFLHNDYQSLRVCSLVCSQWLPPARHHLWHVLVLSDCHQQRGRGLLGSACIGFCVKELEITKSCDRTIASLCTHLVNVKTIRLTSCSISTPILVQILASFPLLQSLTFTRTRLVISSNGKFIGSPHTVEELTLKEVDVDLLRFAQWADSVELCGGLQTLSYTFHRHDEVPGLCKLLKTFGPNILNLHVARLEAKDSPIFLNALSLITNLRLIDLEYLLYDITAPENDKDIDFLFELPQLFRRITSPSITHISLGIRCWNRIRGIDPSFDSAFDKTVEDIAHALSEPQFTNLKKIVFRVHNYFHLKKECFGPLLIPLRKDEDIMHLEWDNTVLT